MHGDASARETPIAPWAGELLQHWLQVRSELKIPGDFLLPSTRTGKPWSKKSHYAESKRLFEEAGLVGQGGGTFKLRHTFAMRQLRRGTEPEVVARWLGVEPEVMARYRQVVAGPMEVV